MSNIQNNDNARRAESVRRLVEDITRLSLSTSNSQNSHHPMINPASSSSYNNINQHQHHQNNHYSNNSDHDEELLLASTVSAAIERGIDRQFHSELISATHKSASQISQICHEHSDTFLNSVAKVVALVGKPCADMQLAIEEQNHLLQNETGREMMQMMQTLQEYQISERKARNMQSMVLACHKVASLLERARKQAGLCRPRAALDCVDEARTCLTASLTYNYIHNTIHSNSKAHNIQNSNVPVNHNNRDSILSNPNNTNSIVNNNSNSNNISNNNGGTHTDIDGIHTLEETPFGKRAMEMLPKIENEVLMGTKRGLNRWFISLRSGGNGSKAGAAALRKCASSMAVGGPGSLGLGGNVQGYEWRALNADNLIARVGRQTSSQSHKLRQQKQTSELPSSHHFTGRVAKAARMGYWYERDCQTEIDRLQAVPIGMVRRAEAFATAFGWYRCWEQNATVGVEIFTEDEWKKKNSASDSRSEIRRGVSSSLGFSRSSGMAAQNNKTSHTQWATALTPAILFEDAPSRVDDAEKLASIPESVHPVRLAESGFGLLGRLDEFRIYYEQNRYGDMKISSDDNNSEYRSSLSSLTGDNVSLGTHRVFFAKSLPHLCASVVGFSAVEAALEIEAFEEEEDPHPNQQHTNNNGNSNDSSNNSTSSRPGLSSPSSSSNLSALSSLSNNSTAPTANTTVTNQTSFVYRFLESSAKHERSLIAELGKILRERAVAATLAELTRGSCLMAAFRSALKIVHPSSATRKSDKELLAMDVDIIMTALKVAQEEQLTATRRISQEDIRLEPMRKQIKNRYMITKNKSNKSVVGIPAEEVINFPFGLDELITKNTRHSEELDEMDIDMRMHSSHGNDSLCTFSYGVPPILRSIHARAIAFAAFALSQQELGQIFASKKGGGIAGYVLDCAEELIRVTIVSMKDTVVKTNPEDVTIKQATQLSLNISAIQTALPRLFGTLMRGMCHVGMIRAEQLDETFQYADSTLAGASDKCEQEIGNLYTILDDICKSKIDNIINFSLENFQWVTKVERTVPNAYAESLIEFMRQAFDEVTLLDDGSKAGLHFACCGQIAERLICLLTDRSESREEWSKKGGRGIPPISKIDALGIKNFELDITALQRFAMSTGVPQLEHCFNELKSLTSALLDKDLFTLVHPSNSSIRQRKYPFLNMELLGNMLEKYVGMSLGMKMMKSGSLSSDILMMEKKDVAVMLKVIRSQL